MSKKAIDAWAWVLIYGGLIVLALGLAVQRADESIAAVLTGLGGLFALAGVLLIFVRSRLRDGDER